MNRSVNRKTQSGLSLIELMIAMALGLILMVALGSLFIATSRSNTELQKSAQQIENGRYAMQLLTEDLKHAGYYGPFSSLPALGATPDPCQTGNAALLFDSLPLPVQAFRAPDLATRPDISATTCGTWLTNANLVPGTDVIVIRRADTTVVGPADSTVLADVYIQSTASDAEIQFGNGAAPGTANKADGTATELVQKNGNAAEIRKFRVHVYFVAPCSVGTGTDGLCTANDDTIPTLKRLELRSQGGVRDMYVTPLAEGIELIKAEWGIDDQPGTPDATTGLIGDGVVDAYVAAPNAAQLSNTIAAKLFVLARNTEPTAGHVDDKTYVLASAGVATLANPNDAFKRHVFASDVLLMNMGGRKEVP
ncbi:MAG: PilW family protein [Burkholderiales bacterium]